MVPKVLHLARRGRRGGKSRCLSSELQSTRHASPVAGSLAHFTGMKMFTTPLVFVTAALVAGCSSHHHSHGTTLLPISHKLIAQDISLSARKPIVQLGQYSIRLVSIADDGTTQIHVAQTDSVLSARPDEYFVSYEFGQMGLELLSASKNAGTANMTLRGCTSH